MAQYWIETLGCPKNQVDSDKLTGTMGAGGYEPADRIEDADLVVINTCAFIDAARQESISTILAADTARRSDAKLVVTGCMAERYGQELAEALPEVDLVAPFGASVTAAIAPVEGVPVALGATRPAGASSEATTAVPAFDLLELPRPRSASPWAYVKVAEGCDRNCGFCAIPSFRGKQRSRSTESILDEVASLEVAEVVLVAQDLAAYGRDQSMRTERARAESEPLGWPIIDLIGRVSAKVDWVRLLYLYPSDLSEDLIDAILATDVAYFDLSLQHVSPPLLRRMRRWGNGDIFTERISEIRRREPEAAFRSNFIVGYPGETEADHDQLLDFVASSRLDWCGFFAYSEEEGTYGADLDGKVPAGLMAERLAELGEMQDRITAEKRAGLIGSTKRVLVDRPGVARSAGEAPEIDGIIRVPEALPPGTFATVYITDSEGPDLIAVAATEQVALSADRQI